MYAVALYKVKLVVPVDRTSIAGTPLHSFSLECSGCNRDNASISTECVHRGRAPSNGNGVSKSNELSVFY